MCRAFVKLPRPWGDQSGGARKWAIRDGCQTWFRAGGFHPDGPPGRKGQKPRSSGGKRRTTSRNKDYAVGSSISPDYDDSFVDDMGEFANDLGPSTGQPWDPYKNPMPAEYYPTYSEAREHAREQQQQQQQQQQQAPADSKPRMMLGIVQQQTVSRPQYSPQQHQVQTPQTSHMQSHHFVNQYGSYPYSAPVYNSSGLASATNPPVTASYSWPGPSTAYPASASYQHGGYEYEWRGGSGGAAAPVVDDFRRGETGSNNSASDTRSPTAANVYPHLSLRRDDAQDEYGATPGVKRETSPLSSAPGSPDDK